MPSATKKGRKRGAQPNAKVSRLKDLLLASGESREVFEREISSLDLIKDFQSVAELQALFSRKPRSVVWLSRDVYLYKRSLRSSLDLLDINRTYEGLRIEIHANGGDAQRVVHCIELHWYESMRSSLTVTESTDQIFGVLARDSRISSIITTPIGSDPSLLLPLSPGALGYFFREATSPRSVSFSNLRFTREQSPMLFSNNEGSVAIQELDVFRLHDGGTSLLRAVKESMGLQQLHLLQVNRMSETFFSSLMTCLSKNRMIHTLSVSSSGDRSNLSDARTLALALVLRVNTSITTFKCQRCYFSDVGWNSLWNAIKVNSNLAFVDMSSSSIQVWHWGDDTIVDALSANTSVISFLLPSYHKRNLSARLEPFLERNRTMKLLRDSATENCQSKRWVVLRHSLRQAKVRGRDPGVLYAYLRENVDNWVSFAPTGREVVERQLQKVDAQRTALLAKLRQYEDPPVEGSRATRKRKCCEAVSGVGQAGSGPESDP